MRASRAAFRAAGRSLRFPRGFATAPPPTPPPPRPPSPASDAPLLRAYLHRALCDRASGGYFANPSPPVGEMRSPIAFPALLGADDYQRALRARYDQLAAQWLTPVEIFKPHYARALANHVLERHARFEERLALEDASRGDKNKNKNAAAPPSSSRPPRLPLRVYELGGGTGACAVGFMDHVKRVAPEYYADMEYVCVDVSDALADAQERSVTAAGHATDASSSSSSPPKGNRREGKGNRRTNASRRRFRVERRDARDRRGWGARDKRPCHVIALEVLDNLPHDRVVVPDDEETAEDARGGVLRRFVGWKQTRVVAVDESDASFETREAREVLEPLTDPLILRACEAIYARRRSPPPPREAAAGDDASGSRALFSRITLAAHGALARLSRSLIAAARQMRTATAEGTVAFVPTGCLALLEALHDARPNHALLVADFSRLAEVRVAGVNAPLVASQVAGGKTVDRDTYLARGAFGTSDVFFPTEFGDLAALDEAAEAEAAARGEGGAGPAGAGAGARAGAGGGRRRRVMTTRAFMEANCAAEDLAETTTASGYNPLLQDFANTRFYVT